MTTSARPVGVFVGLATLDVIHHLRKRPAPDQKVTAERQFVAAGGPASNAAVTFAALGGRARLVTAIGDGPVGRLIRADLTTCGVEIVDVAAVDHEPPVAAISVDPRAGTRAVISVDAGESTASTELDLADGADAVLVDGHHARLAIAAARAAAAAGIDLVLDAGRWKPVMDEVIPHATAVISSAEFRLPARSDDRQGDGDQPDGRSDESARELVRRGVPMVVTTHGPGPVRWWHRGRSGRIDVPKVTAVDTLGAGDAFHGAYLFAACTEMNDLADRLRFAAEVAALRCSVPGPRAWLQQLALRSFSPRPPGQ